MMMAVQRERESNELVIHMEAIIPVDQMLRNFLWPAILMTSEEM